MSFTPAYGLYGGTRLPYHSIDVQTNYTSSLLPNIDNPWGVSNRIIYTPLVVYFPVLVRKIWLMWGATGTGNFILGVYNNSGSKLLDSGSTAKTAAIATKRIDVTDTLFQPGIYWMALIANSTTDSYICDTDAAPLQGANGALFENAGSFALPSTWTPSVQQSIAFWPYSGLDLNALNA